MNALLVALALAAGARSTDALVLADRARTALDAGDTAKAVDLATRAVRDAERDVASSVAAHRAAQDVLLAAGRGDDLVRAYDRILRVDVADPVRRYLRARVEPDGTKRRREIEGVFAVAPDLFWAAYDLAEACALEGAWARAVEYAERATALAPREAAVWNVLGHLRLEHARLLETPAQRTELGGKARDALMRAVELDPAFAEAHYNLGLVRYVLGDEDAAEAAWKKAIEVRPDFAPALNSLGHLAARADRLDEAIELYLKAIAARREYGTAHNNLAVAYWRKKELTLAQKHLALAEAAGYRPAESFERVLARDVESAAFVEFQKKLARSRRRDVSLLVPGAKDAKLLGGDEARAIATALLRAAFRDSHGGVSVARAGSSTGGERRVGETLVARYVEAGRIVVALDGDERLELAAVARTSGASGTRELAPWFADAALRFSATSPELAAALAARLGIPVADDD